MTTTQEITCGEIGLEIEGARTGRLEYEDHTPIALFVWDWEPKTRSHKKVDLLAGVDSKNPEVRKLLANVMALADLDAFAYEAEDRIDDGCDRRYEQLRDDAMLGAH